MERNSFKECSVLAMVSKEEQPPMKACYKFFFHLDRVIAWLNEIATVAHNNSSRRLALNEEINSKLSLRDLDDKNDLGEVEKRTKEKTEQTAYIKTTRELFAVRNRSENKAGFWIISHLKASKWSQITLCILSNVLSCISERFSFNFGQINIPPRPAPSSFLDRIFN